jgi:hypothetical protein
LLHKLGGDLAFLDAVHGLTSHGYPMYTLLVRDEFGNGVPVGFLVTDDESADPIVEFLTEIQKVGASCQLKVVNQA